MTDLHFVTTNDHKLLSATEVCSQFGLKIIRHNLEFQEIQAETGEEIAADKVAKAYAKLGKPVAVTDDSWIIPGLNGFPGPYMKYMIHWLTVEDFLRLTSQLDDRRIILRQIIAYQDGEQSKVFSVDIEGLLLTEPRGTSPITHFSITSFDGGNHSAAELWGSGSSSISARHTAWHDVAEWLTKRT